MIKNNITIKLFIFLISFSLKAYSFSSSPYLIAKSAILLHDFSTASKYYAKYDFYDFDINNLEKKLIAFVNTDKLLKASVIAKQIIDLDINNQTAWIVYLANAKLNNDLSVFNSFEKLDKNNEFDIINFVFYDNNMLKQSNDDIAKAFFSITPTLIENNLHQVENYDYLIFYLSLTVNFNPTFDQALFTQAQVFQILKNYEMAELIFKKINKSSKLYFEAQKNIAFNKKKMGISKEAEKMLVSLVKSNPNENSLIIALADFYRQNKQYKKAIINYNKIINLIKIENEQLWRILYMRGICFERIDQWDKAEKDFLEVLKINPNLPHVLNYLAYGWIERNIFINRSLKMLETAVQKDPDSHYILDSLGWAYYKKNDLNKAVQIMENVIKKAPGEAISLDHLGDIYFSLGRKREAYYMWKQAIDFAEAEDNILDSLYKKIQTYNTE